MIFFSQRPIYQVKNFFLINFYFQISFLLRIELKGIFKYLKNFNFEILTVDWHIILKRVKVFKKFEENNKYRVFKPYNAGGINLWIAIEKGLKVKV